MIAETTIFELIENSYYIDIDSLFLIYDELSESTLSLNDEKRLDSLEKMGVDNFLPAIIENGNQLIDGYHRLYILKQHHRTQILVCDVEKIGQTIYEMDK